MYLSNSLFPSRFGAKTCVHITSHPPVPRDFIQMMYMNSVRVHTGQNRPL